MALPHRLAHLAYVACFRVAAAALYGFWFLTILLSGIPIFPAWARVGCLWLSALMVLCMEVQLAIGARTWFRAPSERWLGWVMLLLAAGVLAVEAGLVAVLWLLPVA